MTLLNNFYISEAIKEANKSTMKSQYGAILVHRNEIVSRGYNKSKGHPINKICCLLRG